MGKKIGIACDRKDLSINAKIKKKKRLPMSFIQEETLPKRFSRLIPTKIPKEVPQELMEFLIQKESHIKNHFQVLHLCKELPKQEKERKKFPTLHSVC